MLSNDILFRLYFAFLLPIFHSGITNEFVPLLPFRILPANVFFCGANPQKKTSISFTELVSNF